MHPQKYLVFLFFVFSFCAPAQIPIGVNWDYTYGDGTLQAMEHTSDGGYVLAGSKADAAITKLDANGTVVWDYVYGTSTLPKDTFLDIRQTSDGGYIAVGYGSQNPPAAGSLWVLKTDANGILQWEQNYDMGTISQWLHAIVQTSDGGYVVAGHSGAGLGFDDVLVMKLSANGTLQWQKTYGGSGDDRAFDIKQTSDGGFIVGAQTNSSDGDVQQNHGNSDIWVLKLDPFGNLSWEQTYGGTNGERVGVTFPTIIGNDLIRQTADGGYILTGTTESNDGDISGSIYGFGDVWLLKLNANGAIDWEKNYGGSSADGGQSVQQTLDGGYVVAAASWSSDYDVPSNQGVEDFWIFKTDAAGTITWDISLGNWGNNIPADIQQVSGCEFTVAGWSITSGGDVGQGSGFWVVNLQIQWPPPLVTTPQTFCWSDNAILADLGVTGNAVPAGFTPIFTWYDDSLKTTVLPETTILADGENYFVSQTIDGCESPLAEVMVNIEDPVPSAASPQEFCEGDNATIAELAVTGQNLNWYEDASGSVAIPLNTNLQDGETYYVSQTIDGCESSLVAVDVLVNPSPVATAPPPFYQCDLDNDGFAEFPLADLDNGITGGAPDVVVSYHLSLSDAENAANSLPDPYTNAQSPEQIVYARVENTFTACFSIVEVQLVASPVPEIAGLEDLSGCDDGNNEAVFDLTQNNTNIYGNQETANLAIRYHTSQIDAESGDNAIPNPENYTSGPKTIFVRLESDQTDCYDTGSFELSVFPRPNIANSSIQEEVCSDAQGGDVATIDLRKYDSQINPGSPTNTTVVYYANANEHEGGNSIENPENYTIVSNPQTIVAAVVDTNTGCPSLEQVEITITVNDRPAVDLSPYDGMAICKDSDPSTPVEGGNYEPIVLETGLAENQYDFWWTMNGHPLSETDPDLAVSEPGEYQVTVTDTDGCSSRSSATLVPGNPPEFVLGRTNGFLDDEQGISVSDITGSGNYLFRLDDGNYIPHGNGDMLIFEDVTPGTHTVYGRDANGCGITVHSITLIGYPKFFTPNGDGQNDRWNIIGLQNQPADIFIFDRYGKLLESLHPAAPGWDGTYNGRPMPSNDYWFCVDFVEQLPGGSEQKQEFVGHFTLKR